MDANPEIDLLKNKTLMAIHFFSASSGLDITKFRNREHSQNASHSVLVISRSSRRKKKQSTHTTLISLVFI